MMYSPPRQKGGLSLAYAFAAVLAIMVLSAGYYQLYGAPVGFSNRFAGARSSSDEVSIPAPSSLAATSPPPLEAIDFALVMMGLPAAREGVTMLKGVLMHASRPVNLHIICDTDSMFHLEQRLQIISRPSYDINVSYYLVSPDAIWERAARAGISSTYHAGAGGLAKVFLHEILIDVDKAMFVDIDTLFTVDPLLLWNEFRKFRPGQVFAVPTLGPDSDELTVCSCSLLLDMAAMRNQYQWVGSTLRPLDSLHDVAVSSMLAMNMDPMDPPFGDQGVYYAIWAARPELSGHLSLTWDVSHCRSHWGFSLADGSDEMSEDEQLAKQDERMKNAPEKFGIYPGILHFNCIDNSAIAFEYSDVVNASQWGPIVQTAVQYKWTWLNRGDGSAKLTTTVMDDVRFADERWPETATSYTPRHPHVPKRHADPEGHSARFGVAHSH